MLEILGEISQKISQPVFPILNIRLLVFIFELDMHSPRGLGFTPLRLCHFGQT